MPITVYASGDGRYPALYDASLSTITTKKAYWPGAFFGTTAEFAVRPVHADGSPFTLAELSAIAVFDFGIDIDWNTGTPPPIRTITGFSIREVVDNGVTWGEIVFEVDFNTTEAGELITNEAWLEMGAELDGYRAGEDRAKLVVQFPFLLLGRRLASGTGTPTPVEDGSLSGPQIWALFADPGTYQFSVDGATVWHETQADADRYYRWTWDGENYGSAVKMPVSGPGDSAYQVWLDAGNEGTEQDFLDSLVAEDGLSAYEVWLDAGNEGTAQDFLDSLVGAKGDKGDKGDSSYSYIAFAVDNQGTGWSTAPDVSKPYIAFLVSSEQLTPVENDFAGCTWVKFIYTGDVIGPETSTNNAIVRFDGTTGKLIQVSIVTITDVGKIGFPDISTTGFMNVAARSVAPTTPSNNDLYVDDGSNTEHGGIGLMQWNGASWLDFGGSVYLAAKTYTDNAIDALVNGAGAALDTLYELAEALGNDPDFAATITNALAGKVATSTTINGQALTSNITLDTDDIGEGTNHKYVTATDKTNLTTLTDGSNADSLHIHSYATEAFVSAAISALVDSSPATLDTLNELAAALGDDPNFATTVAGLIGEKLAKSANLSDLDDAATARDNLELENGATIKHKLDATADPTVNDDSTAGYSVGSTWTNTSTKKIFDCLDATAGAADWDERGTGAGSGDVVGPSSSTNNAIARFDEATGKLIQNSVVVITDLGKITLPDIAATGVLNITPRSTAPTAPATNDLYLDDGTNTASGEKGWRQWNGTSWDDVGAIGGGSSSGGASAADIIIISDFTASRI